ncbi:DNA polymerase IV [Benzoatithermus flavus]|uniref:DNA polymerase IV n=1 Tax=Benzoatithermus flavus TaxID=3108223 RepID=A0ABU8XYC7_9PROT
MRKIVHIDMDAFYAAVEQRDDPSLRGRPLAVGSPAERGVVLTASYEARVFGVRSAMPSATARRLCPELLFVRPRFDAYRRESRRIRAILERFTPLVEPVSLDEAYLDVTEPLTGPSPAVAVARTIKAAILAETGLTASAGVSFNKFLAKIASDLEKPDGLTVIRPEHALSFLAGLPIERFHGVGPSTARRMRALGIATGADLQARSEQELVSAFGRLGRHYWRIAQGLDDRPVEPDRPRRSLSVETTFDRDLRAESELAAALGSLAVQLAERLARAGFTGRTLTLKLRYADFKVASKRATRASPFVKSGEILAAALELLAQRPRPGDALRLLGVGISCSGAEDDPRQLALPLLKETRNAAR